jgi:hypothetical protein
MFIAKYQYPGKIFSGVSVYAKMWYWLANVRKKKLSGVLISVKNIVAA